MDKKVKFEFLEHTADVYIASYGETISEAFENAAIAMFEVMTDTEKIELKLEDTIVVKADDEHGLLYNWLEALLVNFDTKNRIYSKFKILSFKKNKRFFFCSKQKTRKFSLVFRCSFESSNSFAIEDIVRPKGTL